jgi:hypothetical protein
LTIYDVIPAGDEFALGEYDGLSTIQFSRAPSGGSADAVDIEVFDDAHRLIDIYSIPDSDKETLLVKDFAGDRSLALQFVHLLRLSAIIRAAFKMHTNPEIMARQLIIIGQDTRLFNSRLIVPLVQPIATDTFMDYLRKSNLQQLIRGHIARVHHPRKAAPAPSINITRAPAHDQTSRATKMSGIQFPQSILSAIIPSKESTARIETVTPNNTSVYITEIALAPIGQYPAHNGAIPSALAYDCISAQPERAVPPVDPQEPYLPRAILIADQTPSLYREVFFYVRLLFQQYFFARATNCAPAHIRANEQDDFGSELVIDVIDAPQVERVAAIAQILSIVPNFAHSTNLIADFLAKNAQHEYWKTRYSLADTHIEIIARLTAEISARAAAIRAAREYSARLGRLEILASLIEDHLGLNKVITEGAKRATKYDLGGMGPEIGLMRVVTARVNSDEELFAKLTQAERKFILAEYESLRARTIAPIDCKHIALVSTLRKATAITTIRAQLSALSAILVAPTSVVATNTMIKCALCGQSAICPHALDLARVVADHGTRARERESMSAYIERVPDRRLYYCRVCGEYFSWSIAVSDDVEQADPEDEAIASEIYHELTIIQRYFRAQNVVDQHSLVRTIERHIYPFIEAIENKTAIAQTSVVAEFSAKMRIFIAIYAFADCIVNMARLNIIFEGFEPRNPAHIEAYAVKYATDKIILIENVALNLVPRMTREVISADLVSAIGQLRDVASSMPFGAPPRDYRATLMYDPVFAILFAHCSDSTRDQRKRDDRSRDERKHDDRKKGGAKARAKTREPVTQVEWIPNDKDPFDYEKSIFELLPPKPRNPRNVYEPLFEHCARAKGAVASVIANAREMYALRAFDYPIDTANRAIIEYRQKVAQECAQMRAQEASQIARAQDERRIPTRFIIRAPVPSFVYKMGALSAIYDENGQIHKWDTMIFVPAQNGANPRELIEVKIGAPDAFSARDHIYADKKCSVCGILQSKTAALNEDTIRTALEARALMENFYQFFATRCPLEGAHDFAASRSQVDPVCAKCGYSAQKARAYDREYFDKYAQIFKQHIAPPPGSRPIPGRRISPEDEALEDVARNFAQQPWTFNYETVVNASATFKVERHSLQTLGAREGMTREQLADESFVARVPKSRFDARIHALRTYIYEIFMLYAVVRKLSAHERVQTRSILQFLDDLKKRVAPNLTSAHLESMSAEMPSLGALLAENGLAPRDALAPDLVLSRAIELFAELHKPAEIVDYYLETFCAILNAISASKAHLCAAFAHSALARILARENITIKGEHYNLSVVEGTKLASDDFDSSANQAGYDENDEDDVQNALDEEAKDDMDPFSLDAFDMDDERADDDIVDPDDEPTLVHIGDEVGW